MTSIKYKEMLFIESQIHDYDTLTEMLNNSNNLGLHNPCHLNIASPVYLYINMLVKYASTMSRTDS